MFTISFANNGWNPASVKPSDSPPAPEKRSMNVRLFIKQTVSAKMHNVEKRQFKAI